MRRTLVALVVLSLTVGACGDDDDEASVVATTVATNTVTTATTAPALAGALRCESVAFTQNSEDVASDITAAGLSCAEARAFVGVAGRQTSSGGPDQVEVQGYDCRRTRVEQEPLPRSFYECTNSSKQVTFVRS